MNLSDFALLKEDDTNYVIGHPKGKSITVPKAGMSQKAHEVISKLRREEGMFKGGMTDADDFEIGDPSIGSTLPISEEKSFPLSTQPVIPAQAGFIPNEDQEVLQAQEVEEEPGEPNATTPMHIQETPSGGEVEDPIRKAKALVNKGVEAQAEAGESEEKAYKKANDLIQKSQKDYETRLQNYLTADQNLFKAAKENKIDPDRYWSSLDTGSRIAASIGMVLSGMGSAVTGQPNYAMENIKRAINADIQAQQNDSSKTMNLWKMNREMMSDDQRATLATQSQMLTIAKAKTAQAQARAKGPIAAQNAVKLGLELDQAQAEIAKTQALMDMANQPLAGQVSNSDPAKLILAKVPKEHQKEAFKELDKIKKIAKTAPEIMAAFEDAVKNNSLEGNLLTKSSGESGLRTLLPTTLQLIEGKVTIAQLKALEDNVIPNRFDSKEKINAKRRYLQQYLQANSGSSLLSSFGIDAKQYKSTRWSPGFQPGDVVERK